MEKKALVMLYPYFSEYELSVAMSVLAQGGKGIVTAGPSEEAVRGEAGLTCTPDLAYEEVEADDYDCVILPGMARPLSADTQQAAVELLHLLDEDEDMLFAACSRAPYLLAMAGVLQDKRYTIAMYEQEQQAMGIFAPENFRKQPLVQHGNVITAMGSNFIAFGEALGHALRLSFDEDWYRA